MHSYIIINHTYENFEVALFVDNQLITMITDDKRLASKMLVNHLETLLEEHSLTLKDIAFIGVNQGPGLFSTLRAIIATVNALHFAQGIPLIGVDALNATSHQLHNSSLPVSVTLLDAFNHEVYYAIKEYSHIIKKGYNTIELFLQDLLSYYPDQHIHFDGKGTMLYKDLIMSVCKEQAIIPEKITAVCSITTIAELALSDFQKEKRSTYLLPLHLKKHPVELL